MEKLEGLLTTRRYRTFELPTIWLIWVLAKVKESKLTINGKQGTFAMPSFNLFVNAFSRVYNKRQSRQPHETLAREQFPVTKYYYKDLTRGISLTTYTDVFYQNLRINKYIGTKAHEKKAAQLSADWEYGQGGKRLYCSPNTFKQQTDLWFFV